MSKRKRIFLDANVLVAIGFRPHGSYARILHFRNLTLVASEHILTEVAENLADLGIDSSPLIAQIRSLFEITDRISKLPSGIPLQDDEDRQALAEAIGSGCEEFVTFNSRDFKSLYGQTILGVTIRHSADFVHEHTQGD